MFRNKMLFMLLLSSTAVLLCSSVCRRNYTGHKLLTLIASGGNKESFAQDLLWRTNIDIWDIGPPPLIDVQVSPVDAIYLEQALKCKKIGVVPRSNNLQSWIDEEREANFLNGQKENFRFDIYHPMFQIKHYLESVAKNYTEIVEKSRIGTTFEGHPIAGLKIGAPGENKKAFWIDGGMHSREWASTSTVIYFIDQLVKGYDTNSTIKKYLDRYDIYIYPVVNTDGYRYTWTKDRFWNGNRAPTSSSLIPKCLGTDVNKNFDADFGGPGTSDDPCNNFYHGPEAFSEAESRAIRDAILKLGDRLQIYITYHSYSQAFLCSYGYKEVDYPTKYQAEGLDALNRGTYSVNFENYQISAMSKLVKVSGTALDWVYESANVTYSFQAEMRHTKYGYLMPRDQIIPTAKENFEGIMTLLERLDPSYEARKFN